MVVCGRGVDGVKLMGSIGGGNGGCCQKGEGARCSRLSVTVAGREVMRRAHTQVGTRMIRRDAQMIRDVAKGEGGRCLPCYPAPPLRALRWAPLPWSVQNGQFRRIHATNAISLMRPRLWRS